MSIQLSQFLKSYDVEGIFDSHKDMTFYFQKNNYDEKELNEWRIS